MQYRNDNKTGTVLSVLGLGCMRFPRSVEFGVVDMKKTTALIKTAVEKGINYFDTAYIYPGSEAALGSALSTLGVRDKVYIATKLPIYLCKKTADFDRYFNEQKRRLKTGYTDYYLLHTLNDMESWQKLVSLGITDWREEKKKSGEIRRIGFSFHGAREGFMQLLDAYDWDFCQIQYNYSDKNYQAGEAGLKRAAEKGLPVIIMEPLLGGTLARGLPAQALEVLRNANPDRTPAGWAFAWLYNQPEVTCVLSGMTCESELLENAACAETTFAGALTDKENQTIEAVAEILNKMNKIPCTGCGYCLPCPKNVNIPVCFSSYNASYTHRYFKGLQLYFTGTGAISDVRSNAGQCVSCGKCSKHCPQSIDIPAQIRKVKRRMEPLWVNICVGAARFFVGKKRKN